MNQKRRIGKRIVAWFLCLAMLLTTVNLPGLTMTAQAAETWIEVSTYDALRTEMAKGGNIFIKLSADIISEDTQNLYTLDVKSGNCTLDLNGHSIKRKPISIDEKLINIEGGTIRIVNSSQSNSTLEFDNSRTPVNNYTIWVGLEATAVIGDYYNCGPITIIAKGARMNSGIYNLGTTTTYKSVTVGSKTDGSYYVGLDASHNRIKGGTFFGGIYISGVGQLYSATISGSCYSSDNVSLNITTPNDLIYKNNSKVYRDNVEQTFTMQDGMGYIAKGSEIEIRHLTHQMEEVARTEPTLTSDGEIVEVCFNCGYEERTMIPSPYKCGASCRYDYNEATKTLTILGTGDMSDLSAFSEQKWRRYAEEIRKVVVSDGITSIGNRCFAYLYELEEVTIQGELTKIGEDAFAYCDKLTKVIIPNSNITYYKTVFGNNDGLKEIKIPGGELKEAVLAFCPNLETVTFGPSVSAIGNYCFVNDSKVASIYFEGDVPSISDFSFVDVSASAYYPADNETWTESVRQQYGGTITWVPYCLHTVNKVSQINATCTEFGVKEYYKCSKCNKYFEDESAIKEISDFEAWKLGDGKIEKRNHDFSDQPYHVTDDKTQHYQECKECGVKSAPQAHSEVVIPAKEATCKETGLTEGKKCSVCGTVTVAPTEVKKLEHTWDAGKVTKEPTKDADGIKTYTCTKCGETKLEAIDKLSDDIKPTPDSDSVKPLVPEISVKGKFDVAAAVKTVSDKKPVAYAITTGNKKAVNITKKGILTAKKAGEIEITAYADKKKTDEITKVKLIIKDTKVPVKDTISYMDDTCDLKSKITNLPLGIEVKFSISEKQQKIATVDAKTGIITPVKDGKAKVTVEIGEGKNAAKFYTTITVKTPKFSSAKPVVIKAGNSKPLALKNVKSDDKITWSVSDKTKAEIIPGTKDSKIKVKGIAAGRVTLTADVNGHKIIKEIEIIE